MKNLRQILAIAGLAVIALLYILCIVFACIGSELTQKLLLLTIMLTILLPIVLHFISVGIKNTETTLGEESEKE